MERYSSVDACCLMIVPKIELTAMKESRNIVNLMEASKVYIRSTMGFLGAGSPSPGLLFVALIALCRGSYSF